MKAVATAANLLQTMQAEVGVGLAAPQVGQSLRLFVTGVKGEPMVFINPEITERSKEEILWEEGCLSLPRLLGEVRRPKEVTVRATGTDRQPFEVKADGLLARVLQHEYDHLEGILFTDRMDDLRKLKRLTEEEWASRSEDKDRGGPKDET